MGASDPASFLEDTREHPTRLAAGLFLLLGILTLILTSRPETNTLGRYAIGIGVEVALALAALLFMRLERLDIARTLRWRKPTLKSLNLALGSIPGLWISGVLINVLALVLLGYTTPVTPAQFPATWLEALALAFTTVVVAPVCEEIMFRGYIQRAFERPGIVTGILAGGAIFAIYHLRFQGLFALIPVALALGYATWRTQSIFVGMAMHAAYNAIATILLLGSSFLSMTATGFLMGSLICLGLFLTPVSLVALWMLGRSTEPGPEPRAAEPPRLVRWAWIVPLVLLLLVYGYAAVREVWVGKFPERILSDAVELASPPWEPPARWRYAVMNRMGRDLGEATCDLAAGSAELALTCRAEYEGFDLLDDLAGDWPGAVPDVTDVWASLPGDLPALTTLLRRDPGSWTMDAVWAREAMTLTQLSVSATAGDRATQWQYSAAPPTVSREGASQAVPENALLDREWAWRLSGLPFQLPYGGEMDLVRVDESGAVNVTPAFVQVRGGEPTWTPAGNFTTWKVTVTYTDDAGDEVVLAAWYQAEAPHLLVRYDDGGISYVLADVE